MRVCWLAPVCTSTRFVARDAYGLGYGPLRTDTANRRRRRLPILAVIPGRMQPLRARFMYRGGSYTLEVLSGVSVVLCACWFAVRWCRDDFK